MSYRPRIKTSGGKIDFPLDAETVKGKTILEQTYPVGAIYVSVNSTSPASLFGGTWTQIKDVFLLGAGDTYSNGATGGNSTHSHTAGTLKARIKNSTGKLLLETDTTVENWTADTQLGITSEEGSTQSMVFATKIVGSTANENNMPPYLTVYMWKRTA